MNQIHHNQITITGASGFLGFNLTRYFLDQGYQVKALIGPNDNLEEFKKRIPPIYPINIDQIDICDPQQIEEKISGSNIIIHSAGIAHFGIKKTQLYDKINIQGTKSICETALKHKASLLVHISSGETLYRDKNHSLAIESKSIHPDHIVGHYTKSKFESELIVKNYQDLNSIIIHPTTPIGEYDLSPTPPGKLIQMYLQKKLPAYYNAGINFIGINDLVKGIHLAIQKGKDGENYILGGENIFLEEFFQRLEKITNIKAPTKKIPYRLALSSSYIMEKKDQLLGRIPTASVEGVKSVKYPFFFDMNKAKQDLGFEAKSINEDLLKSIKFFQK